MAPGDDLVDLVIPFTNEEVDSVVKNLKADKSPGHSGFNTYFMKKCWETIKYDFL
jgi:hypothetical protein